MKKLMFANTIYAQQEARKWMRMNSCKFLRLFIWTVLLMSQTIWGQSTVGVSTSQPLLQRIEGVWVSDKYTTVENSGLPFYVLIIRNGRAKLDMIGYGYAETLARNSPSNIPKEDRTIAQRIEDNDSSLYIVWSNERLKIPNQHVALGLGQVGGDVAHEITKQPTNQLFGDSFVGELGSDLVSDVFSDVVSSMIVDAFAPSKKINVLEMFIQQNNEYELTAHTVTQEIKIKGQEKPIVSNNKETILFTKYDYASGVFFDVPYVQEIYVPGEGLLKIIPKKFQEIGMAYLKYYDLKVPSHISPETISFQGTIFSTGLWSANPFNIFQIKKLQYFNEKKLLSLGYDYPASQPYLGAQMQIKEERKGKEVCSIYHISPSSPAFLFNIQEGDLLLSIDGFDINTPEQADNYIESLTPFEWVKIRLKRGRKTINMDVELSKY